MLPYAQQFDQRKNNLDKGKQVKTCCPSTRTANCSMAPLMSTRNVLIFCLATSMDLRFMGDSPKIQ